MSNLQNSIYIQIINTIYNIWVHTYHSALCDFSTIEKNTLFGRRKTFWEWYKVNFTIYIHYQ
jgi:hypothetical protein